MIAMAGIAWAANFFWRYRLYEITNDASVDQYVTPINVRITGYIKQVRFKEHQKVKQGDTLLIIDDREFKIKVKEAQAALLDARSSSNVYSSNVQTSHLNVNVFDATMAETEAHLRKLEQDEKRAASLLKIEAISGQQYLSVESELKAMAAHYEALKRQKQSASSQLDENIKKGGNISASILSREAAVEMAELNLSYTVVRAPYDGTMGRRSLGVGQLVQAGHTISYIVSDESKWVTANYKEKQIANIYIGQPVSIRVDAVNDRTFMGTVTEISGATGAKYSLIPTDNSAGNFVKIQQRIPVRIEFTGLSAEDNAILRAGMMVECSAQIDRQ